MSFVPVRRWHWPLAAESAEIFKLISDFKAGKISVGARCANGATLLMLAANFGRIDDLAFIVDAGEDVNAADHRGNTALSCAVRRKHLPVVEYLLKRGASVNCRDKDGATPLMKASEGLPMVQCLIEAGADENAADNYGHTALGNAVMDEHLPVVEYLLRRGANVNCRDKDGATPLTEACEAGNVGSHTLRCLIEAGADINAVDNDGYTTLHRAVKNNILSAVEFLLLHGANKECRDKRGITPLLAASACGDLPVTRCLIEAGADVNAVDNDGETALLHAAKNKRFHVVKYLLQAGANTECWDKRGTTPLLAASACGHLPIVQCLIEAGADLQASDDEGETAYDIAKRKGRADVLACLDQVLAAGHCTFIRWTHDIAAPVGTIAEHDATIQQLRSQIKQQAESHRELQALYHGAARQVEILKDHLSKCGCRDIVDKAIPEATNDCNYPEAMIDTVRVAGAVLLSNKSSDARPDRCEGTDQYDSKITSPSLTFTSVKSCLDEVQGCYADVKEALKTLTALESSGVATSSYAWSTNTDAEAHQVLQLAEHTYVRAVKDIVKQVHEGINGHIDVALTEFAVPIPAVSIKWNIAAIDDISTASEALMSLCSWFECMIGTAGHGIAPAPWLLTATRNMQQLRSLCQQYEQTCTSDDTQAAFAEFTRLCARKQVFTPAARSLLQRLKASDEVWIRPVAAV